MKSCTFDAVRCDAAATGSVTVALASVALTNAAVCASKLLSSDYEPQDDGDLKCALPLLSV